MSRNACTTPRKPARLMDSLMFRPSGVESAYFIAYAVALYLLPLSLLYAIAAQDPSWYMLVFAVPLVVLSGYGLFVLATTGHEGFHFNLTRNHLLSCYVGCLFSSMLPLFCATGFFIYHWRHHRHNNSAEDPDLLHFERYRSVFGRIAIARLAITLGYLLATVRVAMNGISGAPLPLSDADARRLAQFNLLCQAMWLTLYAVLAVAAPRFLLAFVPVLCATTIISSINAYQEHAFAAPHAEPFARTRTSRAVTLLHAGSNFHVEHHLYPSVPCWRLPRVHRLLMERHWYAEREHLLDASLIGTFKYCFKGYRYGGYPSRGRP